METYCLNTENISREEMRDILMVLEREIISNESFLDDVKGFEKEVWESEIKRFRIIQDKLNYCLNNEKEAVETQAVIQKVMKNELTAEQEDYILESYLEQVREAREK